MKRALRAFLTMALVSLFAVCVVWCVLSFILDPSSLWLTLKYKLHVVTEPGSVTLCSDVGIDSDSQVAVELADPANRVAPMIDRHFVQAIPGLEINYAHDVLGGSTWAVRLSFAYPLIIIGTALMILLRRKRPDAPADVPV